MNKFPETDCTRWKLRTRSAPLSASGTHEVVATFMYKKDADACARLLYGPGWKQTFEIVDADGK